VVSISAEDFSTPLPPSLRFSLSIFYLVSVRLFCSEIMSRISFDKKTIPDLSGRVILVTGGTGGIGREIVIELSKHSPARIIFTGRNARSAEATIQSVAPGVSVSFIQCDLASLESVKQASNKILSESRLDLFLANAGIMAKPEGLSTDGYEIQFATNHIGHALLTQKVLPLLEKTAKMPNSDVRIIYTTSTAWRGGSIPFDKLKSTISMWILGRWFRYSNSKLANLLYARELSRRFPEILTFSITPGIVGTSLVTDLGLFDRMLCYVSQLGRILTPEQGSYNHLWAISASRESIRPGAFYEPVGLLDYKMEADKTKDPEPGPKLWNWTEKELEKWMR